MQNYESIKITQIPTLYNYYIHIFQYIKYIYYVLVYIFKY